ncbi:MAG: hypothetical protein ACP5N7_00975 [Candidatus Pacearchaeota archaeon]
MENSNLTYQQKIFRYIESKKVQLDYEEQIFEILEGDVSKYLNMALKNQLNEKAAEEAIQRSCPINILRKIVDKLSKIYSKGVLRIANNPNNQELVDKYSLVVDDFFTEANHQFNAYKRCGIEIYHDVDSEEIGFRTIPSYLYLVHSSDLVNPLKMTEFIKVFADKYLIYTDESLVAYDMNGSEVPTKSGGINEYGIIPFAYISRSKYKIMPISDSDMKQMSILFPTLLSDLNFSIKYLTNPIVYGVDVDCGNLVRNPNVFWSFKTLEDGKTPSIGSITPDADINGILSNVKEQMSFWLETKNIKADAIGIGTTDSSSSGLALLIRNIDTTEDRNQQITYFKKLEQDFWERLAKIHNYLADIGAIKDRRKFTEDFTVTVKFPMQKPIEDRQQMVERLKLEVDSGFNSRENAIKELNPDMPQEQIDDLLEDIDEDLVYTPKKPMGDNTMIDKENMDGEEMDKENME